MTKTDPEEFKRFEALLPKETNLWFIPVLSDEPPDAPKGESSKDEKYRLSKAEAVRCFGFCYYCRKGDCPVFQEMMKRVDGEAGRDSG